MNRGRFFAWAAAAAVLVTAACSGENAILLTVRTQSDLRDVSMTVISRGADRPRFIGPPRRVDRTVDQINEGEPIRLAVRLGGPESVFVLLQGRAPDGTRLIAARCYEVNGIVEDDVMLVRLPDSADPDMDGYPSDPGAVCQDYPAGGGDPIAQAVACDFGCPDITDCGPNDPTIHPYAPTICEDGTDQDCSGGDEVCGDADGDGSDSCSAMDLPGTCDCDDTQPGIHPGATDVCGNGLDEDCVGGDTLCDRDGDGVPSDADRGGRPDCNDDPADPNAAAIHPAFGSVAAAPELCDGVDNDCNSLIDEREECLGEDLDADGADYCPPPMTGPSCDCNDCNAAIAPGRAERCDGIDNDCDGMIDEGCLPEAMDQDRDGSPASVDCDDSVPWIFPGSTAPDFCDDGIATDCRPGGNADCDVDMDGDRFEEPPECDGDPEIHPGVVEICNGKDDDCNGIVDDLAPVGIDPTNYPYGTNGCRFVPQTMPPSGQPIDVSAFGELQHCRECRNACDPLRADTCITQGCDCSTDASAGQCATGNLCCGDGCVDPLVDERNCGGCRTSDNRNQCGDMEECNGGQCRCGGTTGNPTEEACTGATPDCCGNSFCTNLATDPLNCGACGDPCDLANVNVHSCAGRTCGIVSCDTTFFDCNTIPGDGCEINLDSDVNNCGACNVRCGIGELCMGGQCTCGATRVGGGEACPGGSSMGNSNVCCSGTCRDLGNDPNNCNACGTQCGANAACTNRACVCTGSFLDCPSDGAGCGTDGSTTANCRSCGNNCGPSESCGGTGCACNATVRATPGEACTGGTPDCCPATGCANLASSTSNCRTCGNVCGPNETCSMAGCTCGSTSQATGEACTGANGECCSGACTNVSTSTSHCHTCGNACGAGETCGGGGCTCGGTAAGSGEACPGGGSACCSGACTDVTSTSNCRACNNACGAGETCGAGGCTCGGTTVGSGEACAGASNNCCSGSCTDTSTTANCRACNNACGAGETCGAGGCTCGATTAGSGEACPGAGSACCGGMCLDVTSDEMTCGACGNQCGTGETCSGGRCTCGSTTGGAGAEACPGASSVCCGNSVCRNLDTDENNCGGCGVGCGTNEVCLAGICTCGSSAGTRGSGAICTGTSACCGLSESSCTSLTTTSDCGMCGRACPASAVCSSQECHCMSSSGAECYMPNTCTGAACSG
ncbi:MAG: hypothetical protein IT378_20560 [Sandaracinaceae bacterium]|nr:hypothetical protein [Sandaracinaceae bacterium]